MNETTYNPFSLAGKTILVTGASSGIGRAAAVECAKMGATLILTARNEQRLQETLSLLPAGQHTLIPAALGTEEAAQNLVAQLPADVKLDGVVHCAGIDIRQLTKFIKEKDFLLTLQTNLLSPVLLNKWLLKKKKLADGASVVWMSSIAALTATISQSTYAASKAGLIAAMRVFAKECKAKGIRSNCICPAMIDSGMITAATLGISEEEFIADKGNYLNKRYGTPQEVAALVVYLLSDAAQWVTGSVLSIDGGYTL